MSPSASSNTNLPMSALVALTQHERPPHLVHMPADPPLEMVHYLVTCPVCFQLYQDPVTLICGWTVCKECVLKHSEATNVFTCPWGKSEEDKPVPACWTSGRGCARDVMVQRMVDWYKKQTNSKCGQVQESVQKSAHMHTPPPADDVMLHMKRKHDSPKLLSSGSETGEDDEKRAESLPAKHRDQRVRHSRTSSIASEKDWLLDLLDQASLAKQQQKEEEEDDDDDDDDERAAATPILPTFVSEAIGDCQICCDPYTQPVTTPCGHTFCATCLQRTLDHTPLCPICRARTTIQPFMYDPTTWTGKQHTRVFVPPNDPVTVAASSQLLSTLLVHHLPSRRATPDALDWSTVDHMKEANVQAVPVFVCGMVMPGQSYPLHIFEPRYRLMLRRVLTHRQTHSYCRLAMCMHMASNHPNQSYSDVGTWLNIHSVEWLPDGRAIVEAVAGERFRIIQPLGLNDGYQMAIVQDMNDDIQVDQSTLAPKCVELYLFFDAIFSHTSQRLQEQILNTYGPCPLFKNERPKDPAHADLSQVEYKQLYRFSFWIASVFPVSVEEKYRVLSETCIHKRLDIVGTWTERVKQEWWYKRGGCSLM